MKDKITTYLKIIIFISFLLILGILTCIMPKDNISYMENRKLASLPKFNIENLINGNLSDDIEIYLNDHFAFRNQFIMLNSLKNQALLKIENNDVYIGKNGNLYNKFIIDDQIKSNLDLNIKNINKFNQDMTVMLIPSKYDIDSKNTPRFSYNTDTIKLIDYVKTKLNNNISIVDINEKLLESNTPYFKLDHHWNSLGAYIGYKEYINSLGIKSNLYEYKVVSDDFCGSLFAKSGLFYLPGETLYSLKNIDNVDVIINNKNTYNDIYFKEKLKIRDKYQYYLDGNYGEVRIINNDIKEGKKLLILKDSYINIMLPYLIDHFEEIILVDFRFFRENLTNIIKKEESEGQKIDEILLLYSMENFAIDRNLAYLK